MGKVNILGACRLAPTQAEKIPTGQERVRADQHTPGPEESMLGQTPYHAEVAGAGPPATPRGGRPGPTKKRVLPPRSRLRPPTATRARGPPPPQLNPRPPPRPPPA